MIKQFFLPAFLVISIIQVQAQTLGGIQFKGTPATATTAAKALCGNEAGRVQFIDIGESLTNDLTRDTLFLCLNDRFRVDHIDSTAQFAGDPDPTTTPGITYAAYQDRPTIAGPATLDEIAADPSLLPADAIPGLDQLFETPFLTTAHETASSDILFFNNGDFQDLLNAGDPVLLWFAPMTHDRFNEVNVFGMTTFFPFFEGDPAGPCVDVNIDEAFAVVYLNEVVAANQSATGCNGSFTLQGGLPEFDGSAYDIEITLDSDTRVEGTVNSFGGVTHNQTVNVNVPQPGNYTVTVSDGKSCPTSFAMQFGSCSSVTFELPQVVVRPGAEICVDVTVANFTDIVGFQIPIRWDQFFLEFNRIENLNPNLPDFQNNNNNFNTTDAPFGSMRALWTDISGNPISLNDGEVLFSICFTARNNIHPNCEGSEIAFEVDPDDTSGFAPDVNGVGGSLGINLVDGNICVTNDGVFVLVDEVINEQCQGEASGQIIFTVADAVAPYTYELRDATTGNVVTTGTIANNGDQTLIDGLTVGSYELTVVDATSGSIFTSTSPIEIQSDVNFGVTVEAEPGCFGEMNGFATAVIREGNVVIDNPGAEYTFLWSTGETTQTIRNLGSGDYSVIVTNADCQLNASGTITETRIQLTRNDEFSQNASCETINDGILVVDVTGANTSVTDSIRYQWNLTGVNNQIAGQPIVLANIVSGTYSLTVTDDLGCEAEATFSIQPEKIIQLSAEIDNANCFGGVDGRLSVSAFDIGGNDELPYSFTWENLSAGIIPNDNATNSTLSDIPAGRYILRAEDNTNIGGRNCGVVDTFFVGEPDRIALSVVEERDASCVGGLMDGRIEIRVDSGGTMPYTFTWDSIPDLSGTVAENLSPDNYKVIVEDANGCMDSLLFNITAPDLPRITNVINDELECAADTGGQVGVAYQSGASGAAIVSVRWSNGETTDNTSSTLSPGEYTVVIEDANGCPATATATVTAPLPLVLDSLRTVEPECPNGDNGAITVFVSGGTMPYNYTNLTDGMPSTGSVIGNLAAGDYTIGIVDANDCPALEVPATIIDPPGVMIRFEDVEGAGCPEGQGSCNGKATAIAELEDGSERTFDFQWDGNAPPSVNTNSSTATTLCPGENLIRVVFGQCTDSAAVFIDAPEQIQIIGEVAGVSCFGDMDGSATVNVQGGTTPYRYNWSALGQTTQTASGLAPGQYFVTVTDDNDCVIDGYSLTVPEPDSLILTIGPNSRPTVSCSGDDNGIFEVVITGGNGLGFNPFSWSDGIADGSDSTAIELSAGSYAVTVTDLNGCTDTISYVISEPTPLLVDFPTIEEPLCFGGTTFITIPPGAVSGGNGGPYFFLVDDLLASNPLGTIVPNIIGGTDHTITVEDGNGCSVDTVIFVNEPPAIEVDLPTEIEVQLGDSIRLSPNILSVRPIDSIRWTPSTFLSETTTLTPFVRPIDDEFYELVVTDDNGCTGFAEVFVNVDKKRKVYIPNVFAPESIFNSRFQIQTGPGVRQVNFIRIYNRWGELMYEENTITPGLGGAGNWDGSVNGNPVQAGTYVYISEIEFDDGAVLLYRGDVTVVY